MPNKWKEISLIKQFHHARKLLYYHGIITEAENKKADHRIINYSLKEKGISNARPKP